MAVPVLARAHPVGAEIECDALGTRPRVRAILPLLQLVARGYRVAVRIAATVLVVPGMGMGGSKVEYDKQP